MRLRRFTYGDNWPFKAGINSGLLECRDNAEVVFTTGEVTYALNGNAKDNGRYRPLDEIWDRWVDIKPIIAKGLKLGE